MSAPPANDASTEVVAVGLLVGERYRVVERLGQGAMGAVWRAEHTSLGSAVAIKFLHQAIASERDARARFVREAKIAARLGELSRHVTRVSDHGVLAGGTPYLVMELLRGEGLDERLKRQARLPMELVVTIATQLCRALQVAHDSGVVHRDLKPANVFLCVDEDDAPLVKLLDFGVAKALLENEAFMTSRRGAVSNREGR